ncbi:ABC transporter permease [Nocardioides sp. SYSU DS0663]|uniref:ABC transporter permease n=1 Tax=Nocardioides sp. SYSU DS0663 TaxID=3416445 RepID=UPI003F4C47FA
MRNLLGGWGLPLRMARREAARARGRSVLVLVMIALPVLGVTAADIVLATQDVDTVESLDRRLGGAAASVTAMRASEVVQAPNPDEFSSWEGDAERRATEEEVAGALGGARLVPWRQSYALVATDRGRTDVQTLEMDLRDPVARGLVELSDGRLPDGDGEVVVNEALLGKGYAVGDRLDLADEDAADPVVVGVVESAEVRSRPFAAGAVGTFESAGRSTGDPSWLVAGGEVTWEEVRALNELGATALSRAVVLDPPPLPPEAEEFRSSRSSDEVASIALVVVMALLEVVLLAGPAFAVGARRQSRSLALIAATGGTPAQARRVVLAGAMVLGSVATALGVVLGIGAARLAVPLLQQRSDDWFGPFDVPWLHLLAIAAFGLLSAVLAAAVPAWIASRQDVVAVLAGRRGDRRPSLRSPALGVALLGGGVALAAYGALGTGSSEVLIAGAAVVAVLGMILLVPVVLVLLAKVSGRLPLVLRYAVRDAARHRTRTVPAVAAVAATVAGVVALGIATSSDEAQSRATYTPQLALGAATLTWYGPDADWADARSVLERELGFDGEIEQVQGLVPRADDATGWLDVRLTAVGEGRLLDSWGSRLGSDVVVGADALDLLAEVPAADRDAVDAALASGALVAYSNRGLEGRHRVELRARSRDGEGRRDGAEVRTTLDALVLPAGVNYSGPQALLSEETAGNLGLPVGTVGLAVTGADVTEEQEEAVSETLAGVTMDADFYVERGFRSSDEAAIIQAVLAALGAVLMLGGTLTATFLALSDARPDLATLAAVGAAPRTRRGVAAAYAVVVGVVGAVLGAVVGFVPGVAITYPLTRTTWMPEGSGVADHYLDVPWLLVGGLVVALPLLTAVVVGLAARSRLPLVARLD